MRTYSQQQERQTTTSSRTNCEMPIMSEYNVPRKATKQQVEMIAPTNAIMEMSRNMQKRLIPHITLMEVRSDARGEGCVPGGSAWVAVQGRPSAPIGETESIIAVQPHGRNAAMSFGCPTGEGGGGCN